METPKPATHDPPCMNRMAALSLQQLLKHHCEPIFELSDNGADECAPHSRRSMMTDSTKRSRNFISRALAVFGAAASAAAAVEGRRRPHERDLRTLGINPADFS